jgi:hypothetical protein
MFQSTPAREAAYVCTAVIDCPSAITIANLSSTERLGEPARIQLRVDHVACKGLVQVEH